MIALPGEFQNQMRKMLGDETPAFLRAMDGPPALALRLNPRRAGAEAAAEPYVGGAVPWAAQGRYLREGAHPGAAIAHAAGAYYIQEASAMAPAAALDARPGERILDLCAAPGGKSTQIAAAMDNRGLLVSNDPEPARAKVLAGNLERTGAANAVVVSALPDRLAYRWTEYFDALLVDAPCSGEGMFRRDPAAREEWNPAAPAGCAGRQAGILDQAARLLRPGGRLVYSTCTFNRLENEENVRGFLARHPEFTPENFSLAGVGDSKDGMLRLFPHRLRGDGHFVAQLRKAGTQMPQRDRRVRPAKADPSVAALIDRLQAEACALPAFASGWRFFRQGDRLYCAPPDAPALDGLKTIAPGLCLLRAGRNHIEPEHALAMALPPELALRRADLDEARANAWLRGEAVPLDAPQGWTLALYHGMPLGWGKCSNGVLKNHLPRGLRRPR